MRVHSKFGSSAPLLGILLLAAVVSQLGAATLLQLSMEDMVWKSTAIVRGRVTESYAAMHGSIIYTHYQVQVTECWKGDAGAVLDLVVAGGTAGGLRQSFPGSPALARGAEYVLFLWRSPSTRLTHIIGLTQGLFDVRAGTDGQVLAVRNASSELMLDSAGRVVRDSALSLRVADLRGRVSLALAQGAHR